MSCSKTYPILTSSFNVQKLSLGKLESKQSNNGFKYQNIPISYDGKKAIIRLSGRFQIKKYNEDLNTCITVDDENRKLFKEFEMDGFVMLGQPPVRREMTYSWYSWLDSI